MLAVPYRMDPWLSHSIGRDDHLQLDPIGVQGGQIIGFGSGSTRRICPTIPCKIEHFPESGVIGARRIVQLELVSEPGIVVAEDLAEPVEYQTDRAGVQ